MLATRLMSHSVRSNRLGGLHVSSQLRYDLSEIRLVAALRTLQREHCGFELANLYSLRGSGDTAPEMRCM